jgi:hypothetical protein
MVPHHSELLTELAAYRENTQLRTELSSQPDIDTGSQCNQAQKRYLEM